MHTVSIKVFRAWKTLMVLPILSECALVAVISTWSGNLELRAFLALHSSKLTEGVFRADLTRVAIM